MIKTHFHLRPPPQISSQLKGDPPTHRHILKHSASRVRHLSQTSTLQATLSRNYSRLRQRTEPLLSRLSDCTSEKAGRMLKRCRLFRTRDTGAGAYIQADTAKAVIRDITVIQ